MKIFDSLSQKKVELKIPKNKLLEIFVCGPTVYDYSHIGHARTYITFDAFVKYLRSRKIKVFYLQNITDVDDKIINRAKENNENPFNLAMRFKAEYLKDMKILGVNSVNKYARATMYMKEIEKQITNLIRKGFAYQTKNGVYFEVKKFGDYGKLSKQNLSELRAGYRIEPDPEKKDSLDFALWKKTEVNSDLKTAKKLIIAKNGEPAWKSPWGWGRPGWHIEDTAITEKYFGPQYDIHGGGNDLKFPHHESEIAQQEAASGKKPLVKIWMHTGFLLVNGEKMSKSLHNFITIRDFLKNNSPELLRIMVLQNHYRSPFNYTKDSMAQSKALLNSIGEFLEKLRFIAKSSKANTPASGKKSVRLLAEKIKKGNERFEQALNDDFNTPKAFSAIMGLISETQPAIWNFSPKEALILEKFILNQLKLFEIRPKSTKIPANIAKLAKNREKYRSNKQFVQSDELRRKIEMLGYIIEDTTFGTFIRKS